MRSGNKLGQSGRQRQILRPNPFLNGEDVPLNGGPAVLDDFVRKRFAGVSVGFGAPGSFAMHCSLAKVFAV